MMNSNLDVAAAWDNYIEDSDDSPVLVASTVPADFPNLSGEVPHKKPTDVLDLTGSPTRAIRATSKRQRSVGDYFAQKGGTGDSKASSMHTNLKTGSSLVRTQRVQGTTQKGRFRRRSEPSRSYPVPFKGKADTGKESDWLDLTGNDMTPSKVITVELKITITPPYPFMKSIILRNDLRDKEVIKVSEIKPGAAQGVKEFKVGDQILFIDNHVVQNIASTVIFLDSQSLTKRQLGVTVQRVIPKLAQGSKCVTVKFQGVTWPMVGSSFSFSSSDHEARDGTACWWIGRSETAAKMNAIGELLVNIEHDKLVSKFHAKLELGNDCGLYITDNGSRHGTCVNSHFLTKGNTWELKENDTFMIAQNPFKVTKIQINSVNDLTDQDAAGRMAPDKIDLVGASSAPGQNAGGKMASSEIHVIPVSSSPDKDGTNMSAKDINLTDSTSSVRNADGKISAMEINLVGTPSALSQKKQELRDALTLEIHGIFSGTKSMAVIKECVSTQLAKEEEPGDSTEALKSRLLDVVMNELLSMPNSSTEPEIQEAEVIVTEESVSPQDQVYAIFPDVCPNFLREQLESKSVDQVLNELMDNAKYPRKPKEKVQKEEVPNIDFSDYKQFMTKPDYVDTAIKVLCDDFPLITKSSIRYWMKQYNNHYYPTKMRIQEILDGTEPPSLNERMKKHRLQPMKKSRRKSHGSFVGPIHNKLLAQEIAACKKDEKKRQEDTDKKKAEQQLIEEATEAGLLITCGVCYCDHAFELMVQCADGHLFCRDCLKNWAQEQLFGQGKTVLNCMSIEEKCEERFPEDQLRSALPEKVFQKYQEAVAKEALEKVQLPELVTCPFCEFQALLPQEDKVFPCPNKECLKESCRLCKRESHIPLRCEEVAADEAKTDKRRSVEEAMSLARIRECPKCKTRFFKVEGCNKMTCGKCGTKSCYICRQQIDDYSHFCQAFNCNHKKCKRCVLYSNTEEDDRRAMEEAGLKTKEQMGAEVDVTSLLEEESAAAKAKKQQQQRQHPHQFPPPLMNIHQNVQPYLFQAQQAIDQAALNLNLGFGLPAHPRPPPRPVHFNQMPALPHAVQHHHQMPALPRPPPRRVPLDQRNPALPRPPPFMNPPQMDAHMAAAAAAARREQRRQRKRRRGNRNHTRFNENGQPIRFHENGQPGRFHENGQPARFDENDEPGLL